MVKICRSKNYSRLLTKVSGGFELGICGSRDKCLRSLSYGDLQPNRPIY